MKLYQIIIWGTVGVTLGYFLKLIWGEPLVFVDLFTRIFFLIGGIVAGWYFRGKDEQTK